MMRGIDVSLNTDALASVALSIMRLCPNDISFLIQYGTFLRQILNNDIEAENLY
jgi:hypothetical protein